MRMGGTREAIWQGLIHAGPGSDADGKHFYRLYEAQELFRKHEAEIGVTMGPMVYLEDQDKYVPDNEVRNSARILNISGTELRQRLNEDATFPAGSLIPRCFRNSAAAIAPPLAGSDRLFHRPVRFWKIHHRQCPAHQVLGDWWTARKL